MRNHLNEVHRSTSNVLTIVTTRTIRWRVRLVILVMNVVLGTCRFTIRFRSNGTLLRVRIRLFYRASSIAKGSEHRCNVTYTFQMERRTIRSIFRAILLRRLSTCKEVHFSRPYRGRTRMLVGLH